MKYPKESNFEEILEKWILDEKIKWKKENDIYILIFCNGIDELEDLGYIWFSKDENKWCCRYNINEWDILKAKSLKQAKKEYIKKLRKYYKKQISIYKNLIKILDKSKEEKQ